MEDFPKNIQFTMTASNGSWKGTFAVKKGRATINAILIDKDKGVYKVIMKAPTPYPGPYEYILPYEILNSWKNNANSATYYNSNIRGNTAYFPK